MSVCPAFWRRAAAWSGGACADGSRPARRPPGSYSHLTLPTPPYVEVASGPRTPNTK